jgi:ribosomal protein S27AE
MSFFKLKKNRNNICVALLHGIMVVTGSLFQAGNMKRPENRRYIMHFKFWRKKVLNNLPIRELPYSSKSRLDRCMNCIRFTRDCTIDLSDPPKDCKLFYQLNLLDIAKYKKLKAENTVKMDKSTIRCPQCGGLDVNKTYSDRFECKTCGQVFS